MRRPIRKTLGRGAVAVPVVVMTIAVGTAALGQVAPAPRAPDRGSIEITGRIIAPSSAQPPANAGVRIQTAPGTDVEFTFTDAFGNFKFLGIVLDPREPHFIVVDAPGFETYRQPLDYQVDPRRGGFLTVLLEPSPDPAARSADGSGAVDLSQILAEVPEAARQQYEQALRDVGDGRDEQAAERLERVVEMAPEFFDAFDALGAAYVSLGRYDAAEEALNRALELNPGAGRPLLNLGTLFYQAGETHVREEEFPEASEAFIRAIEYLQESIRREPLAPMAYHHLGAALYRMGGYEPAEAALREALRLNPAFDDARLVLINVYTRQSRYDDALAELDLYVSGNPGSDRLPALERLRSQIEAARAQ
jgi:Tfp pilus assembly protein PilF